MLAQVADATEFPPNPQIDKIFAQWDKPDSPGCAIAVTKAGDIIYKRGYGMANLDHKIRITPSTVFHAASLAKQFTAMSIMLLVQRGQLSLEDDVRKHILSFRTSASPSRSVTCFTTSAGFEISGPWSRWRGGACPTMWSPKTTCSVS